MEIETIDKVLAILKIVLITNLILIGFFLGIMFNAKEGIFKQHITASSVSDCSKDNLITSVECLRNNFTSWFHFNITAAGVELNESELKQNGGVCSHASEWYVSQAKQLGYYGKTITFYAKNMIMGHEIALVYADNLSSYCLIDQQNIVGCSTLNISRNN